MLACNSRKDKGGVVDGSGLRVDHVANATVMVAVLKDLTDTHQTHFSDIKVGIGCIAAILLLAILFWVVRRLYEIYTARQQDFVNRRAQSIAKSIIRKYANSPGGTPATTSPS